MRRAKRSRSPWALWRSTWLCVLAGLLILGLSAGSEAEDNREKFEKLRKQIETLKSELETTKTARDTLLKSLEKNEKQIGELNELNRKLEKQMEETRKKLQELREQKGALLEKKNSEEKLVGEYLSAAFQLGHQSELRVLLNQEDPARLARMLNYYQRFSLQSAQKIASYRNTVADLEAIEPRIEHESTALQSQYAELQQRRRALQNSQSDRKVLLVKLEGEYRGKQNQLQDLVKDRKRLEHLLNMVTEGINQQELNLRVSAFASLRGKMPWPTQGRLLHRFGSRRSVGGVEWQGLEIESKPGTAVVAVHRGQVVFADYLRGYGLLIIVDHGDGYMTLYAHNQYLYKETGEWVETGERIAAVGDTGGLKTSALYFELRHNGKPTNPQVWLRSS